MRPLHVVVRGVLGQDPAEVPLAEDQHAVGQLGADGQHEALGEAVRPRTARRDLDHLDTGIGQYRVERGRELAGAIADEEPEPAGGGRSTSTRPARPAGPDTSSPRAIVSASYFLGAGTAPVGSVRGTALAQRRWGHVRGAGV